MSLENVLSRISCGTQLDSSQSSFNKGSQKKSNIDEVQGALSGLGIHETIYLFWAFMDNEKPMKIRAMLNTRIVVWLKNKEIELSHSERTGIVRAVMKGVKGSGYKVCNKCESTGVSLKKTPGDEIALCDKCGGTGKVAISKREVARAAGITSSTFNRKKHLNSIYEDLMGFCSVLEGNCFKHFSKDRNDNQTQ